MPAPPAPPAVPDQALALLSAQLLSVRTLEESLLPAAAAHLRAWLARAWCCCCCCTPPALAAHNDLNCGLIVSKLSDWTAATMVPAMWPACSPTPGPGCCDAATLNAAIPQMEGTSLELVLASSSSPTCLSMRWRKIRSSCSCAPTCTIYARHNPGP